MGVWQTLRDVVTPGNPRHQLLLQSLAAETARLDSLTRAQRGGGLLHPHDQISVATHELVAGWSAEELGWRGSQ